MVFVKTSFAPAAALPCRRKGSLPRLPRRRPRRPPAGSSPAHVRALARPRTHGPHALTLAAAIQHTPVETSAQAAGRPTPAQQKAWPAACRAAQQPWPPPHTAREPPASPSARCPRPPPAMVPNFDSGSRTPEPYPWTMAMQHGRSRPQRERPAAARRIRPAEPDAAGDQVPPRRRPRTRPQAAGRAWPTAPPSMY